MGLELFIVISLLNIYICVAFKNKYYRFTSYYNTKINTYFIVFIKFKPLLFLILKYKVGNSN